MKTFLTIKFALLPYLAFYALLGWHRPGAAILVGLGLILALGVWRATRREIFVFELGTLLLFATLGGAFLIAPAAVSAAALWLALAGQGVIALASLVLRRPWTADYARAAYPEAAGTPQFYLINAAISGLWGILFLLLAACRYAALSPIVPGAIVAFGALISIFGPRFAIRMVLARLQAAREAWRWPAPDFGGGGDCDVAVVGAGIGGLTAAALLADAGLRVMVFDQHVLAGGFCHCYPRKARWRGQTVRYRFDAGPHDFSGVWDGGPVSALLARLGIADRIEWRRIDHSYRTEAGRIDPPRDWRAYARLLGERFPDSAAGIGALFEEIHAIFEDMYATGATRGGFPGMPASVEAMLAFPKEHPHAFTWMNRPFDDLVASHVRDPQVVAVLKALSGYLGDGSETLTCADMAPIFGYYFKGGFYPVGGTSRFAEVLVEAIEERGGTVQLKTPVARILVENGRATGVQLRNGRSVSARAVVTNADLRRSFLELVGAEHLPADFRANLAAAAPAPSAFTVQLGLDYVPAIKPATHLDESEGLGIATMSLVDPSAAPPGHSIMNLIRLVPHGEAAAWFPPEHEGADGWKAWRRSADYEARKKALGDEMIAAAESILPELKDHIVYRSDASPVTYARYDWASGGAIYGVSGMGRLKGSKSPVQGLVVAGGGNAGAGVEAVVISGANAAEALVPGVLARPRGHAGGQALPTRTVA